MIGALLVLACLVPGAAVGEPAPAAADDRERVLADIAHSLVISDFLIALRWSETRGVVGQAGPIELGLTRQDIEPEPIDLELKRAVHADPTSAPTRFEYAEELRRNGRSGEAFVHFRLAASLYAEAHARAPDDEQTRLGYVRSLVAIGRRARAQQLVLPLLEDEGAAPNWEALHASFGTLLLEQAAIASVATRDFEPLLRAVQPIRQPVERALRLWNGELVRADGTLLHWPYLLKAWVTLFEAVTHDQRLADLPRFEDAGVLLDVTRDYFAQIDASTEIGEGGLLVASAFELGVVAVQAILRDPDAFEACFREPPDALATLGQDVTDLSDALPDEPSREERLDALLAARDLVAQAWPLAAGYLLALGVDLSQTFARALTDDERETLRAVRRRLQQVEDPEQLLLGPLIAVTHVLEGDLLSAAAELRSQQAHPEFIGSLREVLTLGSAVPRGADDPVRELERLSWEADHAFTHIALGFVLFTIDYPEAAALQYTLAQSKSLEDPAVLGELGVSLVAAGRTTVQAEGALTRSLELEPFNARGETALAVLCARQDRWDEAAEHALRATLLEPNDGLAHMNEAHVLRLQADHLADAGEPRAAEAAAAAHARYLVAADILLVPRFEDADRDRSRFEQNWGRSRPAPELEAEREQQRRDAASESLAAARALEDAFGEHLTVLVEDRARRLELALALASPDERAALAADIDALLGTLADTDVLAPHLRRLLAEAWLETTPPGDSLERATALATSAVEATQRADAPCLFTLSAVLDRAGRLDRALDVHREGLSVSERQAVMPTAPGQTVTQDWLASAPAWSPRHDAHLALLDRATAAAAQRGDADAADALEREWFDLVAQREGLAAWRGEDLLAWGFRHFEGEVELNLRDEDLDRVLARAHDEGGDDPAVCVVLALHRIDQGDDTGALTYLERTFELTAAGADTLGVGNAEKTAYDVAGDIARRATAARAEALAARARSAQLDMLDTAARREPDEPLWPRFSGWIHFQLGDDAQAETALRRATELDPDDAEAFWMLGLALASSEQTALATEAFERSVALDPDHGPAHSALGSLRFDAGDTEGAVVALRRAIEIAPEQVGAHVDLGRALAAANDPGAARAAWERALEIAPDHPAALFYLGLLALDEGRHDEAAEALARVLEIDPRNGVALEALLRAHLARKDAEAAFAVLDKADAQLPGDPALLLMRIDLAVTVGLVDEAVAALIDARALSAAPAWQLEISDRLLQIHAARGDDAAVAEELERRVDLFADAPLAWAQLAAFQLDLADDAPLYDGALMLDAARRAVDLTERQDPDLLVLLLQAAVRVGDAETAIAAGASVGELIESAGIDLPGLQAHVDDLLSKLRAEAPADGDVPASDPGENTPGDGP